MSGANKIKFGLKNVHYAPITVAEGVFDWDTPIKIPGAVNLSLPAVGDKTEFFADNLAYFVTTANQGYEGDLEMALVPDHFRVNILKEEEDANGALFENADAIPNEFALLFEFSGDKTETRHVLYNCAVARPDVAGKTKEKSIDPQTETLKITASPLPNGDVKAKLAKGKTGYDTFFDSVYQKGQTKNTVEEAAVEFDKKQELQEDITIEITSAASGNSIKNVKLNGAFIPGIYLTVAGVDVTIAKEYLATLNTGEYTITVELIKGNVVTVILTVVDTQD